MAARVIGAPTRISHEYECSGWLDRWLVNQTLPQDYTRHSIENNFDVLPLIGAKKKLPSHALEIFLTPDEEKWAGDFLAQQRLNDRKLLGIHVGSGSTKNLLLKRWPLKHYLELIQRLNRERNDVRVLLFGGPDEAKDHQVILAQANRDLVMSKKEKAKKGLLPKIIAIGMYILANGGVVETLPFLSQRGHGVDAPGRRDENAQSDRHRNADTEPD